MPGGLGFRVEKLGGDLVVLPLQVDEEETVGEGDLLGGVVVFLEVGEELAAFVNALKSRGGSRVLNFGILLY